MKFKFTSSESDKVIEIISRTAAEQGIEVYLVGGFVRDRLLGIDSNDIDISVIGEGIKFANTAASALGTRLEAQYRKFGTSLLRSNDIKIEFATARKESYQKSSRKPDVEPGNLEDDISRRDFTINSIAVSLNSNDFGRIIDLYGGLADLKRKIIRTPLEPDRTFSDDPLRMMRAVRFASQLNFRIDDATFESIQRNRDRIRTGLEKNSEVVSRERVSDELLKIISSPKPSIGLNLLQKTGLMEIILPEAAKMEGVDQRKDFHHKDVFYHTLMVVDNISKRTDDVWLRLAALMHDIAKPATKKFVEGTGWTFHGHEEIGARWQKKIFTKLKLPADRLNFVEKLVRLHLRPIALAEENVTDSAIRRLIFEAGDDIDALMMLCRADITSKDPDRVKKYLSNFDRVEKRVQEVEERDRIRNFQSPVRGEEIMKICGIQPSKTVGIIKKKIEEAILDGEIPNEYDAALEYLYKIKDEMLKDN